MSRLIKKRVAFIQPKIKSYITYKLKNKKFLLVTLWKQKGGIMKKKLKDLTLKEVAELCSKQLNCYDCPFEPFCQQPPQYIFIKEKEEKEIDL